MRLQLGPEPPYFHARCVLCQQSILSGHKYADLDGKAFKAYYHKDCVDSDTKTTEGDTMTITIKIRTGNAAFEDDKDAEIRRILCEWIADGAHARPLYDYNGNRVGSVAVTGK